MPNHLFLSQPVISRIAPTPSGYLHLGNVFNFVLTAVITKANKGHLLLRIDDLDAERKRIEFIEDIFEQINWLALPIDEGPSGTNDFETHYTQLKKANHYLQYIKKLSHTVYACQCSRSDILNENQSPIYHGKCLPLQLDQNNTDHTLRVHVPKSTMTTFEDLHMEHTTIDLYSDMGDFILRRKGGLPSYQLVSTVEDIESRVNLIVRGEDLIASTAAQMYLRAGLDVSPPPRLLHHPLYKDDSNKKLSKSDNALSLKYMRQHGLKLAQLYGHLSKQLGFEGKASNFNELLDEFTHHKIELRPHKGLLI